MYNVLYFILKEAFFIYNISNLSYDKDDIS